ncbi:sulfotransferase family protein [Halofilum ochraceum]|uniref:sulfotransferase family protein n=1 Tax=Halofilum ochraceum TaxID=1611323 RepID=UPI000946B0E6|nr:sulfotransferase [Halofilum ochraceum]
MQKKRDGAIPFEFLLDFFRFLYRNRDLIEVITYADLCWQGDENYEEHYIDEWKRWKEGLKSGRIDRSKIYLLIQHDVDNNPDRTTAAIEAERSFGLRSNVMIFNEALERVTLAKQGIVRKKPYPICYETLKQAEREGFVIGYHSNAVERAEFDLDKAQEILRSDYARLKEEFNIEFFSPHGGVRGADGQSNAAIELPPDLRSKLKWVHNRHTVRVDGGYSDGGMNGQRVDVASRDPRRFIETMRPGGRYRILLHPQYYATPYSETARLASAKWYQEIIAMYGRGEWGEAVWPDTLVRKPRGVRSKGRGTWLKRFADVALRNNPTVDKYKQACSPPVFIGGDGRSGTTLASVILDSHSEMAIGPELHFNGKKLPNLGPYIMRCLVARSTKGGSSVRHGSRTDDEDAKPGIQFINRCSRAGISPNSLRDIIRRVSQERNSDIESFEDRCALVERLGQYAARESRASRWGFKIMREVKNLTRYGGMWPEACYLHVIRDGRDVAASQLAEHGSWGYRDIEAAAEGWVALVEGARSSSAGLKYREVRYEDIVSSPRETLGPIMNWLGEGWQEALLSHQENEHSVVSSSVAHPSKAQVAQPINGTSVGRYKRDLSPEEIARFDAIAGDLLVNLGYDLHEPAGEC